MTAPEVAQAAGFILAIIAGFGGVVGYFRANVSKATIELYKQDNEALRARLSTLEDQARSDRAEIDALKSARTYLASVVTQADNIAALRARVEQIATKVGA